MNSQSSSNEESDDQLCPTTTSLQVALLANVKWGTKPIDQSQKWNLSSLSQGINQSISSACAKTTSLLQKQILCRFFGQNNTSAADGGGPPSDLLVEKCCKIEKRLTGVSLWESSTKTAAAATTTTAHHKHHPTAAAAASSAKNTKQAATLSAAKPKSSSTSAAATIPNQSHCQPQKANGEINISDSKWEVILVAGGCFF